MEVDEQERMEAGAQASLKHPSSASKQARPNEWLARLRSYFYFNPLIWAYTLLLGPASLASSIGDHDGRLQHKLAHVWSWLIMKTIFSPVMVTGLDRIDATRPHVYAVNHASALDIPVLYAYLPFQFRIVFKKELLSYPLIGSHLRRSGQVCIDQQNPARSIGSIRSALKSLQGGMPLVVFPEGGRTDDGTIKPFLPGAFFLAIKAGVDIVPVTLVGMYELLPMNTYTIKSRPLEMHVGQPISTAGLKMHDLEALAARVQKAIEDMYYTEKA
jgi:1-acyl-sn-glycerol-3-phosphate acyltransferase